MKKRSIKEYLSVFKSKFSKKSDEASFSEEPSEEEIEHILVTRDDEDEVEEPIEEPMTFQQMKRPSKDQSKKFSLSTGHKNFIASIKNSSNKESIKNIITDVQWENIIVDLFSPAKRPVIHGIFLVCLTASAPYLLGKLFSEKLKSLLPPARPSYSSSTTPILTSNFNINSIDQYNLFNALDQNDNNLDTDQLANKKPKVDLKCTTASTESKLPIKLVNTTVLQDSVKSIASVQVRGSNKIEEIREGEKLQGMAKIGRINRLKMVIKNLSTDTCEYIENEDSKRDKGQDQKKYSILNPKDGQKLIESNIKTGIRNEGNKFKIKNQLRDEMLGDISEVLTQARAIQMKNPDGTLSFKITEIVPGSIFSKLNINDGDILTKINGKPIENLNEIMNLFGSIKDIQNLQLSLKRNGEEEQQEYSFED